MLAANEARACSCLAPPPPATALERSAAVFVGEVLEKERKSDRAEVVSLRVSRAFKGVSSDVVTLSTPVQSAACGRTFEVGKRYLVYAEHIQGGLHDHLCTRTALLENAKADVEALEAISRGETPPPERGPAVEDDGEGSPPSGAADGDQPALDETPAPSTQPAPGQPAPGPVPRSEEKEQPGGHCAAVDASAALPFAVLSLAALLRQRRRRASHAAL